MKVKLIDNTTPRSDFRSGGPGDVTLGAIYEVAENAADSTKYSIINDKMKIARYSKYRFEVVDSTPVLPLRDGFNMLTLPMRMCIRELEQLLANAQSV